MRKVEVIIETLLQSNIYGRMYSRIKNKPENALLELRELFKDPKGIRKKVDEKLSITEFIKILDKWGEFYEKRGNWYNASLDLLGHLGINLEVKGLENLAKIKENESAIYAFPHNHELEGLAALGVIGSYIYDKHNKNVKAISNYLFKGIDNLDKATFFIKNVGHKGKNKNFNKRVFLQKINPYLRKEGHIIHFLTPSNPYWFFGMKEGKLYKSFAQLCQYANKVVPIYVEFSKKQRKGIGRITPYIMFISRDMDRFNNILSVKGPATMYIGEPIDSSTLITQSHVQKMIKEGGGKELNKYMIMLAEWMRGECKELQKKSYSSPIPFSDLLPK